MTFFADEVQEHVNNIKSARKHIPEESQTAFDNMTVAGDVVAGLIRTGEAVGSILSYIKAAKRGK